MYSLNLVFHGVNPKVSGEWQVTLEHFNCIFNWCLKNIVSFCIYFDDGIKLAFKEAELVKIAPYSNLAIVTGDVGTKDHYSWSELCHLSKLGFSISSHGVSHSSLCRYDDSDRLIMKNPAGGEYISSPRGKQLLNEKQIEYQLVESKKELHKHGFEVSQFVFPYGLYSKQTIEILDNLGIYSHYVTCDPMLYTGGKIIPRLLVYGNRSADENILCLTKLIEE